MLDLPVKAAFKSKTVQRAPQRRRHIFPKGGHFRAEVGPKKGSKIDLVRENAGYCTNPAPAIR